MGLKGLVGQDFKYKRCWIRTVILGPVMQCTGYLAVSRFFRQQYLAIKIYKTRRSGDWRCPWDLCVCRWLGCCILLLPGHYMAINRITMWSAVMWYLVALVYMFTKASKPVGKHINIGNNSVCDWDDWKIRTCSTHSYRRSRWTASSQILRSV